MIRQRKPRINLVGYENDHGIVLRTEKPNKWIIECKSCKKEHEQSSREIQKNNKSMSCENYKPPNWSGLDREDAIIRRQYGISMQEFNDLLQFQNNVCAICSKSISSLRRRMNIDHCHDTNKVRGILCSGCNTGLGHLGDNVDGLKKAIEYLNNPTFNQYSLAR
jgi:hypothetical protein